MMNWNLFSKVVVLCTLLGSASTEKNLCENTVHLVVGREGVIPCGMNATHISWSLIKGDQSKELLVSCDRSGKDGPAFDSSEVDILPDGSLVIKSVERKHQQVYNIDADINENPVRFYSMRVHVFVFDPPAPVIRGCVDQKEPCFIPLQKNGELICTAEGVPTADFRLAWYTLGNKESLTVMDSNTSVISNGDGSYNLYVTRKYRTTVPTIFVRDTTCSIVDSNDESVSSSEVAYLYYQEEAPPVLFIDGCPNLHGACTLFKQQEGNLTCSAHGLTSPNVTLDWAVVRSSEAMVLNHSDKNSARGSNGKYSLSITTSFSLRNRVPSVVISCLVLIDETLNYSTSAQIILRESPGVEVTIDKPYNTVLIVMMFVIGMPGLIVIILLQLKVLYRRKPHNLPSDGENPDDDTVQKNERENLKDINCTNLASPLVEAVVKKMKKVIACAVQSGGKHEIQKIRSISGEDAKRVYEILEKINIIMLDPINNDTGTLKSIQEIANELSQDDIRFLKIHWEQMEGKIEEYKNTLNGHFCSLQEFLDQKWRADRQAKQTVNESCPLLPTEGLMASKD